MAKINYEPQAQINALIQKLANSELENSQLSAIVESAGKQIDDLEKKLDEKVESSTQK